MQVKSGGRVVWQTGPRPRNRSDSPGQPMRDEDRTEIRGLALFRNMASPHFDAMMKAAYAQEFPPRLELLRQGGRAAFLHVLVEGTVELTAEWNGREATMALLRPVRSFILAACIRDAPYLMSARTLDRSRIVMIPSADVRAAFRSDPDFAVDAIGELASGYRGMVRHAKSLKLRNARERLAALLLRLSAQAGGAPGFMLPQEKRVLASYLGIAPESLSRAFRDLSRNGVHLDGRRVTITDPDRLGAIALLDPLID